MAPTCKPAMATKKLNSPSGANNAPTYKLYRHGRRSQINISVLTKVLIVKTVNRMKATNIKFSNKKFISISRPIDTKNSARKRVLKDCKSFFTQPKLCILAAITPPTKAPRPSDK